MRQRVRARDMSQGEPLQVAHRSGYVLRASEGLSYALSCCCKTTFFLRQHEKQHEKQHVKQQISPLKCLPLPHKQ